MRRMLTKNQLNNVVNEGIISGEISNGIAQDNIATGTYNSDYGYVKFSLEISIDELLEYNFVIFSMNNTFVMTPLAQSGNTRALGNFVYDGIGSSMIAMLTISPVVEDSKPYVYVYFDDDFSGTMAVEPDAELIGIKF